MYLHIIYRCNKFDNWTQNDWTCYYLGYDVNKANFIAQQLMTISSICYIVVFNNNEHSIKLF